MLFNVVVNTKNITCVMKDDAPNLSISISAGKENKSDSSSSGERKENSQS